MSAITKHSSLKMSSSSKTNQYKHFFIILFLVLVCSIISITLFLSITSQKRVRFNKIILKNIRSLPEAVIKENVPPASLRVAKCTYWNCFDVYQCGHDRLSVYVYPLKKYVDEHGNEATEVMSQEFYTILKTIIKSKYYTPDPKKACIFVPSIDTLNQMRIRTNLTSRALNSLPYWNGGENHLLFNMLPGQAPDYSTVLEVNTGRAMLAGAGFNSLSYRAGFDVSLPVFTRSASTAPPKSTVRPWLVVSAQSNLPPHLSAPLRSLARSHREMLVLSACSRANHNDSERCDVTGSRHTYPDVLGRATFCLVARGARLAQAALLDAVAAGCVPVVSADGLVMPFADSIDWKLGALFVPENEMGGLLDRLKTVSDERAAEMQRYIGQWHSHYFADLQCLTLATLETIERRVLPHAHFAHEIAVLPSPPSPLFLPITAPRAHGFTAVILTYDRLDSLFLLVEKLARVPSAVKVLVVWNNQNKAPPPAAAWPRIGKPLSITRTSANRLSNRFRPYEEIETEAILTIDDDIVMLTADELEFGYEVWREFPDRIVGFPSRTHVWDNVTAGWRYESEWTNEISMVLTGAAFHHKYWNHMYTTTLPSDVRDWVDEHMNCEDIAMNFLVANVTNKPPIKVAPRKKFKCPECTNNEMLSADLGHMVERSQCVDRFARAFGRMPLRSVEFRADPVLYKDPFPEKLKRFNDVGSL